jgi:hypothetical protein
MHPQVLTLLLATLPIMHRGGNLAVFYKNFSYSDGLISLGKITSGIEALNISGAIKVKIELEK